jgi:C-terminal processing protease CtpA/Prc
MRPYIIVFLFMLIALATISCRSSYSPEEVFESVWEAVDQHYALFDVKSVDWNALHERYHPMIGPNSSDEEVFSVITAMLSHLNDSHVMLSAPSLKRDFSAGYLGRYIEERGLAGAMEYLKSRPLPTVYFETGTLESRDEAVRYGWTKGGNGYLHLSGFENTESIVPAVDLVLNELSEAEGLIVDIRHNGGGDDRVGKAIADRFADQKRLYMVTRERNGPARNDFNEPRYWHLEPTEHTWTKPTILITNRLSISAAENFALAMRALPHVTVIGDTTSGCFADMKWFDLPNGWELSVSKNLFVDYAGRCWEGIGVPPDEIVESGTGETGIDPALEKALDLLQDGGPALQDESASANAIRDNLIEKLGRELESFGFERAYANFQERKKTLPTDSWYVHARDINVLGYRLLSDGRITDAVDVFKLYVKIFPGDWNAYDSLGEGLMKSGDTAGAIASYERSVELNPDNEHGKEMLKKLRNKKPWRGGSVVVGIAVILGLSTSEASTVLNANTDRLTFQGSDPALPTTGPTVLATRELWRAGANEDGPIFGVIVQAMCDEAGRVYVLDGQLNTILIFDSNGEFLKTIAREGDGPGEIRHPNGMVMLPDGSIGISKAHSGHLIRLDRDGIPQSSIKARPAEGSREMVWLEGAAYRGGTLALLCQSMTHEEGKQKTLYYLAGFDQNGNETCRYFTKEIVEEFSDFRINEIKSFIPKGRLWTIGPTGRVFLVPERNQYRVDIYTHDGNFERTIGRNFEPVKRNPKEKDARRKAYEEWYTTLAPKIELENVEPAILQIMVDADKNLWVLSSRGVHEQPDGIMATFDVFDAQGLYVRRVAVACSGDGRRDDLFLLGGNRLLIVKRALDAKMAAEGIPLTFETEAAPMEIVCLKIVD